MMLATVLRNLADGAIVRRAQLDELGTTAGDLADELTNLVDALTELIDAGPGQRADARELVIGRADDVLAELASAGLIAPRLGNGARTGRELTLARLTRVARTAAAPVLMAALTADEDLAGAPLDAAVEAVLVDTGYLPAAR